MSISVINKIVTDNNKIINSTIEAIPATNLIITYFNQHCFNIYIKNKNYKKIIDNYIMVFAEATGMYWALRIINRKKYHAINATDLYEKILSDIIKLKKRIFIIGGNFTFKDISSKIPICGYLNGYLNNPDFEKITEQIENVNAEVIVLGLGVPKQEYYAYEISRRTNSKLFICVGNFLEFYLGKQKRIPKFLRNSGMEWMFRLIMNPKRLWKRYLLGIPLFIYRVFRYKFQLLK